MTKEWYELCQLAGRPPFDAALQAYVNSVQKAYAREYERSFSCPPRFMNAIAELHDHDVVSAGFDGSDYIIVMDDGGCSTEGSVRLVLKNAVLEKQDFDGQDLGWCYAELYPAQRGYELHVLFYEYGSDKTYELTAECENVEITNTKDII